MRRPVHKLSANAFVPTFVFTINLTKTQSTLMPLNAMSRSRNEDQILKPEIFDQFSYFIFKVSLLFVEFWKSFNRALFSNKNRFC